MNLEMDKRKRGINKHNESHHIFPAIVAFVLHINETLKIIYKKIQIRLFSLRIPYNKCIRQ